MQITKFPVVLLVLMLNVLMAEAQATYPPNDVANPREGCYAFINATIVKDAQTTVKDAILVIRQGR